MIDEILAYNKEFVEKKLYEQYTTSKYPDKKIAILTCMDTRLVELLPASFAILRIWLKSALKCGRLSAVSIICRGFVLPSGQTALASNQTVPAPLLAAFKYFSTVNSLGLPSVLQSQPSIGCRTARLSIFRFPM